MRTGTIRARVFKPLKGGRQTVLVVPGLHPTGIEERRLIRLARTLAEANVTVVTPDIREISRFEIVPIVTDHVEDVALWLSTASGLAPSGRIGLIGISFSGGLAVAAAGRASLRTHLRYVLSFGGHDDLGRVLEYLCSENDGDTGANVSPPHDYGVAIVLLNVADRLVPEEQLKGFRQAVLRFLWASYLHQIDTTAADREFEALRTLERTLREPAATLFRDVNTRDVARLGERLRPYIGSYGGDPALSPIRSPMPSTPVYLLHGKNDTVIPVAESRHLADRLRGRVPIRLLVTALISHAEADQPAHIGDVLRLADFWGDLLAQ